MREVSPRKPHSEKRQECGQPAVKANETRIPGDLAETQVQRGSQQQRQSHPHDQRSGKGLQGDECLHLKASQQPPDQPRRRNQRRVEETDEQPFGKSDQTNSAPSLRQRESVFALNVDQQWNTQHRAEKRNQPRKAVFAANKPVGFPGGSILTFKLSMNHGGWNSDDHMNNNLGRFRLSVTDTTNAVADPLPANVREILSIPAEKRSPAQVEAVFSYWRTTVPQFKEGNDKIEALWKQWPEGTPTLTLVAREGKGPIDAPRTTHMLRRGDWLKPGQEVTFGVPAFLHPLPPGADGSRLTLAKWLVDRKSPTTARVLVNRVWQAYFGSGIVNTPEDFGLRCEEPSHPELLDWLACEFMDSGWSIKHLHRLIANSAAYRQSSRVTPELYTKDPYNRLLARASRFRVEGEIVRDIALSASGLLNPAVGGRSVYPPAPDFLFQPPASYGPKVWKEESGAERYRRSLYIFKFRSVPYPMLQTFDAPNGDFSCVRRQRSNTPLQALCR